MTPNLREQSAVYPLVFEWTGEAMVPLNPRAADRQYVVGERYRLEPREERSTAAHNHEFAWLHDAWLNLPETIADQYPSPEHLRKRALIQAGFYNEEIIDVGSKAGAIRVAASLRGIDDFALVLVRGPFVIRRAAKSQSRRAMNKQEFTASKAAIMEVIAGLIGVAPDQLGKAA
jgi:hypothetical protein